MNADILLIDFELKENVHGRKTGEKTKKERKRVREGGKEQG